MSVKQSTFKNLMFKSHDKVSTVTLGAKQKRRGARGSPFLTSSMESKGASSRTLPSEFIDEALDNIADKLLALFRMEVMISHLKKVRERPSDSLSSFTTACLADKDSAVPPKVPSS